MDFKKSFIVLIAIIYSVQLANCFTCVFSTRLFFYICEIRFQKIDHENQMLEINGEHLNKFKNDHVNEIQAKESEIHMFPSLIIDQFINLKYLHVSKVKMREISKPLSNNEFQHLPGGIFAICTELYNINMANGKLRTIDANAFVGTKIQNLNLSGNQIKILHSSVFEVIPSLWYLMLSDNLLTELPEKLFTNNQELYYVLLDNNRLTTLPAKLLPNQTELNSKSFKNNQINKISAETFAKTPNLETLALSGNNLVIITGIFNLLPEKLKFLDLSSNQLTYLKAGSINPISQLRNLNFSYNKIEMIDQNFFRGATNLQVDFVLNHCTSTTFKINNEPELRSNVATQVEKCHNSVQNAQISADAHEVCIAFSFIKYNCEEICCL